MVNRYIRVDPVLLQELKNILQISRTFLQSQHTYLEKIEQLKRIDHVNSRVEREIQRQFSQLIAALSEDFRRSYGFIGKLTINPDDEANTLLHDSFDIRKKIDNMSIRF